jgi:hypothetical protein
MYDALKERGLRTAIAISLGCAAAIAFTPTSASAITAVHAVYHSDNAGIVHEIGEKRGRDYRARGGYGDRHHHHHHYYGYRPYRPYHGYGYWPGYYPNYYGGYGYADPYWSRPGLSIGFSFSN